MCLELGKYTSYLLGTLSMKPKIPCLAGFIPVIKEAHATEDTAGWVDFISRREPVGINFDKFGHMPC
jgi:hypothetical protein